MTVVTGKGRIIPKGKLTVQNRLGREFLCCMNPSLRIDISAVSFPVVRFISESHSLCP